MENVTQQPVSVNGHRFSEVLESNGRAKPKAKAKSRRKLKRTAKEEAKKDCRLWWWATSYVVIAALLSGFLNGYANAQNAPIKWAAWGMGAAIPIFVLILFKVAGYVWKRGCFKAACIPGLVGTGLLLLSVWDCQLSINLLTHSSPEQPMWLSWAFAIGIDCGLVACEIAAQMDE